MARLAFSCISCAPHSLLRYTLVLPQCAQPNCQALVDDSNLCAGCSECENGYWLDFQANSCQQCPQGIPNCETYSLNACDSCATCKDGYQGDDCSQVSADSQRAQRCPHLASAGCLINPGKCSAEAGACSARLHGSVPWLPYMLAPAQPPCPPSPARHRPLLLTLLQCTDGYQLVDGVCEPCPGNTNCEERQLDSCGCATCKQGHIPPLCDVVGLCAARCPRGAGYSGATACLAMRAQQVVL